MIKNILKHFDSNIAFTLINISLLLLNLYNNNITKKERSEFRSEVSELWEKSEQEQKKQWGLNTVHIFKSTKKSKFKLYTFDENRNIKEEIGYLELIRPVSHLMIKLADENLTFDLVKK